MSNLESISNEEVKRELVEALECVQALDLPYKDAVKIIEARGWRDSDRFDLPATEFVAKKVQNALKLAKAG